MGQQLASRFGDNPSSSASVGDGRGDEAAWWCKLLARVAGAFAGAVGVICGAVTCLTSIISPLCIVGGILLMLSSIIVLIFEVPFCCTFNQYTKPIAVFAEKRSFFQKAGLYLGLAILSFVLCQSVSTFFGCCLVFASGVIYGLMGLGRKADRQHMMATAAASDPMRRSGNSGPVDEASVGLIDNEDLPPLEPFIGQK